VARRGAPKEVARARRWQSTASCTLGEPAASRARHEELGIPDVALLAVRALHRAMHGLGAGVSRCLASSMGRRYRSLHVCAAVDALRDEEIVDRAQESNVVWLRASSTAFGRLMVELQERPCSAVAAVRRHERAAEPVTCDDFTPGSPRDVRPLRRATLAFRATRLPELRLLELLEKRVERPLDDNRQIPTRIRMAHQIASKPEFLPQCAAHGHFHEEAVPSERFNAS
jgi:hypothetical protein